MTTTKLDRFLAAIPHLLALIPIPLLNIFIVYLYLLIIGQKSEFASAHAKANLNFQISYQLYVVLFFLAIFAWNRISPILRDANAFLEDFQIIQLIEVGITFLYFGALLLHWLFVLLFLVAAIVKALFGKNYKFPLVIPFFKR